VPAIGLQKIGNKIRACVVSLNEPKGKHESMPDEEIKGIYKALKTKYSPHDITIFTNRGVDVSFDSKPEDLEIIKIPQAIFADLEK
jgi:adenine-specific DNA-methyltransferase